MKNSIKIGLLSLLCIPMVSTSISLAEKESDFINNIDQNKITDDKIKAHMNELIDGKLPLMAAINSGKLNAVKTLIRLGAAPDIADEDGTTPLMAACEQGFPKIVAVLLAVTKDVNQTDKAGNTALMHAVVDADITLSFKFINIHGDAVQSLHEDAYPNWIQDHINQIYVPIVQQLLQAGALVDKKNHQGNTPLIKASAFHYVAMMKALIDAKANVNEENMNGETPLIITCSGIYDRINIEYIAESIKTLIRAKADVNHQDSKYKETALITLISNRYLRHTNDQGQAATLALIDAGTDVEKEEIDGNTALMLAVRQRIINVVNILIQAKANLHKKNKSGETALILAARSGDIQALTFLIQLGADVNAQDNYGNTALIKAATYYESSYSENQTIRLELAEILINAGADVNRQNIEGNTALIETTKQYGADAKIVALLLKAKADPHIQNKNGETALSAAKAALSKEQEYDPIGESSKTAEEIVTLLEEAQK